jgi:gamma-glutamyltranspeptidase/glutathione hydrolase
MAGNISHGRPSPCGGIASVAAGHPVTVQAARQILQTGGNAFDAAVGAACAAAVAEPGLTSLGGGGFLLADPIDEEPVLVDFFVDTPGLESPTTLRSSAGHALPEPQMTPIDIRFGSAVQRFNVGYGSVAVPGCLAGYLHIHRRWGRLDLRAVMAPAIEAARAGVAISHFQAQFFALLEPIFTLTEPGRQIFAPQGRYLTEGDLCTNPQLATFLEDLAAGASKIHGPLGSLAGSIERDMAQHGGLLTAADLAAYRVVERPPLLVTYRGVEVLTNPPPSFGGSIIASALASMEEVSFTPSSQGSAEVVATTVRGLRGAVDRHRRRPPYSPLQASKGTTHISIIDADGNVAAMTTSNGSGSGVFLDGTGIHANNNMGEEDLHPEGLHAEPPGLRVGSMMAPTIVRWPDGRKVALGTGGSERIRSALTQVLSHLIDFGDSIEAAIGRPRYHWDGKVLQCEDGFADTCLEHLDATFPTNRWERRDLYFGGVHSVDTTGHAAGDDRRGGHGWVSPTPG